jgi:hypothetical protein
MAAKKINNNFIRPLAIIVVIAVIITIWVIHDHNHPEILKTRTYTSTQYNFKVAFPGTPTTSQKSKTLDGISANTTFISSSIDNGSQHFEIYASNLPQIASYDALNTTQKYAALTTGVNSAITVLLSATAITSSKTTYLGYPAIETQFRTLFKNRNINGYSRVFVIGQSDYLLLSTGAAKTNFLNFANSFKYTGN